MHDSTNKKTLTTTVIMVVDSFFTNPKKRKRPAEKLKGAKSRSAIARKTAAAADEEITSESEVEQDVDMEDQPESEEESDYGGETEADKRRRLAKQYLSNLKDEIDAGVDADGFDAADLDRENLSRRLREDVAEDQGKIYRFIGSIVGDYVEKNKKTNKLWSLSLLKGFGVTAVAAHFPHAYTVTKDLYLTKWDISVTPPKQLRHTRGDHRVADEDMPSYIGHRGEILCVAVSPDGKHVVTGGRDRRLVVWSSSTLSGIKVLETRDRKGVVTGLAFRRGTNELYASCADLKVRTYNIDHQSAVETLYGHQDCVSDVSALGQERCVTVGARDRTAMLWKISEESRLTFRGGESERNRKKYAGSTTAVFEGSMDCCSMIDDTHFITGTDNGTISLWSTQKKKAVFTVAQAHGIDDPMPASLASAELNTAAIEIPPPQPRYITALCAVPFSDVFFSGSWNGEIKVWKLSSEARSFECVGTIPGVKGFVNRISVTERVIEGASVSGANGKLDMSIVVAVSKEPRLGRWKTLKKGKNGILVVKIETK